MPKGTPHRKKKKNAFFRALLKLPPFEKLNVGHKASTIIKWYFLVKLCDLEILLSRQILFMKIVKRDRLADGMLVHWQG